MKAILINEEIFKDKQLTYEELVHLIALNEDYEFDLQGNVLESLENKKFIKLKNNMIVSRQKGISFINSLKKDVDYIGNKVQVITKKTEREVNSEIENRIDEYRNLFKGYKKGAMGSLSNCKSNLSTFLKNNPNYSFDDVLNAAKSYINNLDDFKYLKRADYFIYKQNGNKSIDSTLEAYIDEPNENNDNWTTKLS